MANIQNGTYAILNVQTGQHTPTPLGECKPSEVDLKEHEEIRIWMDGDWCAIGGELTPHERGMLNIRAFLDAIHDELERMEHD